MCGFAAMNFTPSSFMSAPLPPLVTDVPTNSDATVGDDGSE